MVARRGKSLPCSCWTSAIFVYVVWLVGLLAITDMGLLRTAGTWRSGLASVHPARNAFIKIPITGGEQ